MTELQRLLAAYEQQQIAGSPCALATVVQVEGSAYRRPGARMLITAEGQLTGTISGGCLEGDARRRAQQVMLKGEPEIVVYDSMDLDDDLEFGAQLGCQGRIHVLIEPLHLDRPNLMQLLQKTTLQQKPVLLNTVLSGKINERQLAGSRILLTADGIEGTTGDNSLDKQIINDARTLLKDQRSATSLYETGGESFLVFNELIMPATQLTVYGAGNDVQPLVRLAYTLGWRVTVIDGRPNLVTRVRFPEAEQVRCVKADDMAAGIVTRGFALLMSHNYYYDLSVLRQLCNQPEVSYIGMLGPRKKADRLLDDLQADGIDITSLEKRLYSPVGIDIGAEAAEEIAVAIIAELIAVRNGHPAGFLKNLDGPIHKNEFAIQQNA